MTETEARKVALAADWLKHHDPIWTEGATQVSIVRLIDYDRLGSAIADFGAEREAHAELARRHADEVTGYMWDAATALSGLAAAHAALYRLEYERLEAEDQERRVMTLAASLIDGEPEYEHVGEAARHA